MATPSDITTDLALEIDGTAVTSEKFQRAVRAFFGVLNEVTRAVCPEQPKVEWRVQVKAGSNLIGVSPAPGFSPAVIMAIETAIQNGIAALETGPTEPPYFTEAAVRHARDLGDVVGTDAKDDTLVRLWVRKKPIAITHHSVANAADLLGERYEDYGSVEGRLETISEHGALRFMIYEPIWDRAIQCYITDDKLSAAIDSFGKRVEVYGHIRYRGDGTPTSIRVDDIVAFPQPKEIPDFRSVFGILRDAA